MPDILPSIIDSPETARMAVRAWAARADRMKRMGELAIMLGRCHTEQHLRFLIEALCEYLGIRPEPEAESAFPKVEKSKETRMVEMIPLPGRDTRPDMPLPAELGGLGAEAEFEEIEAEEAKKTPDPLPKPAVPLIRARETPFTKIVKTSPLLQPEGTFEEMEVAEPPAPPAAAPPPAEETEDETLNMEGS